MKINPRVVRPEFFHVLNVRVIDGDAIEATIELSFGACVIKRIRLKGFWAPEKNGRQPDRAIKAHQQLEDWLVGRELFIRCPSERQDRYGRVVAELWSSEGIADPAEVLRGCQLTAAQHKDDLDYSRSRTPVQAHVPAFGEGDDLSD